jgi:hypothetical protein
MLAKWSSFFALSIASLCLSFSFAFAFAFALSFTLPPFALLNIPSSLCCSNAYYAACRSHVCKYHSACCSSSFSFALGCAIASLGACSSGAAFALAAITSLCVALALSRWSR